VQAVEGEVTERNDVGRIRECQELVATIDQLLAALDAPATPERIALLAHAVGDLETRADLRLYAPELDAGIAVRRGGNKGRNSVLQDSEAKRAAWRGRYAELRRTFPETDKQELLAVIRQEDGVSIRTLRRYIKAR